MSTVEVSTGELKHRAVPAASEVDDPVLQAIDERLKCLSSLRRRQKLHINLLKIQWAARGYINSRRKRVFDLMISLILLPFVLPFFLIVAVAIKLDSQGPVFFLQKRVGKSGRLFCCYKFRSMYKDADSRKAELMHLNEANGIVFKIKHDPRVTRVGRLLRKTSMDELPQIINVIKGDMSLVGPRPPIPAEVENYKFDYLRRLEGVPGITGRQQIIQRIGLEFDRWVELDVEYIHKASLGEDIEILVKTIFAVITGRGAY